jgi:predicted enzyme related to lactoylglutathione lyase
MGERRSYEPGAFCWADIGTSDVEGAKAFYGRLFDWESQEVAEGGGAYVLLRRDGHEVAGLYPKQDESVPTVWLSYIAVEDVEASTQRAEEHGAHIIAPPFDAARYGRGAVLADPTGAVVGLWQAGDHPGATLVNVPGAPTWNELNTRGVEQAIEFYGALFGWSIDRIPEADPAYWTITNGGRVNGGMRELDDQAPGPFWLEYFAVEGVDTATRGVRELGGRILVEPMSVPAGRFSVAADPQGGVFALFEGELDD